MDMIQCKICGTPLDNDDNETLDQHWEKQHLWHKTNHKDMSAREAIIKERK